MKYDILPLRTAFLWIFTATILISGSASIAIWTYKWNKRAAARDENYRIVAILQQTNDPEPLKTIYFAELLGLSHDQPAYLTSYKLKNAQHQLLKSPLIKSAEVQKIYPGTLYIEYTIRHPIAFLGEYVNASIDKEGIAIPFKPFYTPKNLPEIILGDIHHPIKWGDEVGSARLSLAIRILEEIESQFGKSNVIVRRLDVSLTEAPSAGQREILLTLDDFIENHGYVTRYLRLGIEHYVEDIQNYWILRDYLNLNWKNYSDSKLCIDLRVPHLAFLSPVH